MRCHFQLPGPNDCGCDKYLVRNENINCIPARQFCFINKSGCEKQVSLFFPSINIFSSYEPFSSASVSAEEAPRWTTTLSAVMGTLVGLVALFALLVFLQYRRLRKGYSPLMETHLSSKRYTEEAVP